jgi:glycosyltransferase involved in cell wall biosynthesis
VDLDSRFSGERAKVREEVRTKLGVADRTVFTHVGALGGLYLAEEIADLLGLARKRNESVFAMFLTQSDPELIVPLLKERGFTGSDMFVAKVAPAEIENYLYASDVGISFVKASYATQSRSPTKIPEYLACGLPVIANRGVGDVDNQLIGDRTGIIVNDLSERGYAKALDEVEKLIAEGEALADRCKLSAKTRFDLESVGGRKYSDLYRAIIGNRPR